MKTFQLHNSTSATSSSLHGDVPIATESSDKSTAHPASRILRTAQRSRPSKSSAERRGTEMAKDLHTLVQGERSYYQMEYVPSSSACLHQRNDNKAFQRRNS